LCPESKAGWIDVGSREDFAAAVSNINVPVVIVAGDQDRVDPLEVVRQHIVPLYPTVRL
jgi:pimeloyl-ACP methyl ester carboxylesterase